jgi:hypothetical protein
VGVYVQAGPVIEVVTLSWQHAPGPFSYNVYQSSSLLSLPQGWVLKTNVTQLSVQIAVEPGEHFFTVSCVDTNTGLESPIAIK